MHPWMSCTPGCHVPYGITGPQWVKSSHLHLKGCHTRIIPFDSSLSNSVNSLRPRQNGRHFPDNIFKCIFLNEIVWNSLKISLKFVPMVRINNIPSLAQKMAWSRPGDKTLSEPMMVSLLMHICITRPQWVKSLNLCYSSVGQFNSLPHET